MSDSLVLSDFWGRLAGMRSPTVLELGARPWEPGRPGSQSERVKGFNRHAQVVTTDIEGPGVDVTVDAHRLADVFGVGTFDAFLCLWTLEHLTRPWVVAEQLARVVRPGGIGYAATHQSYPYHPYPKDYWRFSREALEEVVFHTGAGWKVLRCEYSLPCKVVPLYNREHPWNFEAEAWEVVEVLVERLA